MVPILLYSTDGILDQIFDEIIWQRAVTDSIFRLWQANFFASCNYWRNSLYFAFVGQFNALQKIKVQVIFWQTMNGKTKSHFRARLNFHNRSLFLRSNSEILYMFKKIQDVVKVENLCLCLCLCLCFVLVWLSQSIVK